MKVGNKIKSEKANWTFSGKVADTFVEHINQSVPFYKEGHELICNISDYFCSNESIVYEIGSSTGELIKKISLHNKHKPKIKFIGIDNEINMIKKSKKHCKNQKNISFIHKNISEYKFKKSDFIVSYYTIQFIPESVRQIVINNIYNSLNWGGAFIMFEKVRAPDARFQDMSNQLYNEFKEKKGFSASEILNKTKSLKNVLSPFSTQGNIDMLKRSGFVDINSIMKYICFEGFVCIK